VAIRIKIVRFIAVVEKNHHFEIFVLTFKILQNMRLVLRL